jgi:hypothetical protein
MRVHMEDTNKGGAACRHPDANTLTKNPKEVTCLDCQSGRVHGTPWYARTTDVWGGAVGRDSSNDTPREITMVIEGSEPQQPREIRILVKRPLVEAKLHIRAALDAIGLDSQAIEGDRLTTVRREIALALAILEQEAR